MRRLQLSIRARADIAEISIWSEANWGRGQRDRYINELLDRLAGLLSRPQIGPPYGANRPGLRRLRIGVHVAFYRFDDERIFVVRVLDQRRDIETQLSTKPLTMTEADIRLLALALPEAVEADHHGMPSFRVAGKIFCTIHQDRPRMMVKLDAEDQRNLAEAHPGVVEPVPGYWGRKGSTFVWYEKAGAVLVERLLGMAWANVAPKRLKPARL